MAFMDKEMKDRAMCAVGEAVAVNVGGYAFKFVDPIMQKINPALNQNDAVNGKNAKWIKSGIYTFGGVALKVLAPELLGDKLGEPVGDYGSLALFGLSAGNLIGDPSITVPSPIYKIAGNPQRAPMVQQTFVRSGNVMS